MQITVLFTLLIFPIAAFALIAPDVQAKFQGPDALAGNDRLISWNLNQTWSGGESGSNHWMDGTTLRGKSTRGENYRLFFKGFLYNFDASTVLDFRYKQDRRFPEGGLDIYIKESWSHLNSISEHTWSCKFDRGVDAKLIIDNLPGTIFKYECKNAINGSPQINNYNFYYSDYLNVALYGVYKDIPVQLSGSVKFLDASGVQSEADISRLAF